MIEIREYLAADGASPYRRSFDRLNAEAAAKITGGTKKRQQADIAAA